LQSVDPKPVTLIAIETKNGGTPWLRYCTFDQDVTFPESTGDLYEARPFAVDEVTVSSSDRPGITITLADADLEFDTWLQTTDFRHHRVWRYTIERDEFDSALKTLKESYRISHRERIHNAIRFTANPLLSILSITRLPRRSMTREDFPGMLVDGRIV
ncbi:MAG: hypothetical protein DRQ55_18335, partial [Planctomycetota bacterium]